MRSLVITAIALLAPEKPDGNGYGSDNPHGKCAEQSKDQCCECRKSTLTVDLERNPVSGNGISELDNRNDNTETRNAAQMADKTNKARFSLMRRPNQ